MGVIHRSFGQKSKGPPQSDFLDAKVENQFKSRPNPKISEQTFRFCAYLWVVYVLRKRHSREFGNKQLGRIKIFVTITKNQNFRFFEMSSYGW